MHSNIISDWEWLFYKPDFTDSANLNIKIMGMINLTVRDGEHYLTSYSPTYDSSAWYIGSLPWGHFYLRVLNLAKFN